MQKILAETLKQFNNDLRRNLKENYLDIILYGSSTINDFVPNKGDIDFIVILEKDLTEMEINLLFELHDEYRSKKYGNLEYQLEGTYYPEKILEKIDDTFVGCYIGTGRKGWKEIISFQNNVFDLIQIKNNGICYNNGKYKIYEPTKSEIRKYIIKEMEEYNNLMEANIMPSHSVIQFASRTLYYIKNKRIGSKKESCKEYSKKYDGNKFLQKCGEIKYPENHKEIEKQYPEHKEMAQRALNDIREMVENDL
jgi:hypothetical protein